MITIGKGISSSLTSKINGTITRNTKMVAVILNPVTIDTSKVAECTFGNEKNQNFSVSIVAGKIEVIINCISIPRVRYKSIEFISLSLLRYTPIVSRSIEAIQKINRRI
jgi:hypothetical protein